MPPYKVPLLEPIVKWTEILTKVDSSKSKDYVIAQAKSIVRSVALASMLAISSMRVRISICECEFIHTQRAELSPCPCTTLEQEEALRILVVCDSNRHLFDKEDKKRVAKAKVWIEKHQELARSSRASDVVVPSIQLSSATGMVVGRVTASTAILQNEQPASITRDEIINAIERALEQVLQSSSITASSRLLARAMFVATPPRTDVEHDTWCEVCNKLCEGGLNPPDKDIWMAAVRSVCRNDPGKVEYLSDCFPFERWELMGNPSAAVLPRPPADDIRPIPVILPVESQPSKQTASKDKSSIKKKNFLRRRVRTQDPTRVPTDQEVAAIIIEEEEDIRAWMRMGDVQRFDINNDNQPRFTLSQLGQHERSQHPVSFVISMTRSSGAVTENTKNLFSHHAELAEAFCLIFQSGETELLHSRMEAAGIGRLILLAKVHTIGSAQIQAPDYTEGINVFGLREFCSLLPELPKNSVITLAISHPENMPTVVPRLLVDLMQRVFYRTGIANQDILLSAMGWHIQGKPSGVPHDPVEISLQDLINEIEAEEPQLFEVAKRVQGEGSSSLNPLSRFIYAMYNAYSVRRKCEAVQGRSHYTSSKVPVIQKRDSGIVPILCDARFFVDMRSHTEMAPQDSLHRAIAEWRLCTTSESRAQRKHALSRSIAKLVAGAPVMVPKRTTATITYPIRWFKTVIQRDGTAVNKYLLPVQIKLQNNLGDVLLPLEHYFVRTIAQTIIESDTDDVPQNIFDYCVVAPNSQATLKHLMVQINEVEKGFARRSPVTKGHVEITFTRTFQPKHELKHSFDVIGVPSVLGPIPTGQQTYAAFVSSQTGLSKVYLWEAPGRNGLYVSKYAYTPLKIRIHARPGTVALPAASNLQGNDVISLSSGCPSSTATTAKFKIKVLKNRNVDEVSCAEIHANNAFAMEELDDEQRPTGHYWGAKGEQAHPTQFSSHPSVFSAPESDDPCGRNIVRIFTEFLPAQCIWRLVEVASDEISLQSE